MTHSAVTQNMTAVREAFRRRRLARRERQLYSFYLEHNLLDEARTCRATMLDHLRDACRQWRTALGLAV